MSGLALRIHRHPDRGHGVPSFWTHVAAHARCGRLDRELAAGVPSWQSSRHAARALQLTTRARRASLAEGLDRLIDEARRPNASLKRLACVLPCRRSVLVCESLLQELSSVLDGDRPLDVTQVARLAALTRDGVGPLYCRGQDAELRSTLEQILARIVAQD